MVSNYYFPPPAYGCVRGPKASERGISNNLMESFVCMDLSEDTYGNVVVKEQLSSWSIGMGDVTA